MTQDNDKERRLGLTTAQTIGSALAAMSGAMVASLAGTTGTVIGAAVASVIATVGATMYTESIRQTGHAAKKTAAVVRQRGALITGALPRTAAEPPPQHQPQHRGEPGVPDPTPERSEPAHRDEKRPDQEDSDKSRWELPWGKVAIASVAVMFVGLAGITAVEAMTGEPVSSLVGADDGQGTTVGHVVGGDGSAKQDPTPDENPPANEQEEPEPTSEPSEEPEAPEPSTEPDPTTNPTEAPEISQDQAPAP